VKHRVPCDNAQFTKWVMISTAPRYDSSPIFTTTYFLLPSYTTGWPATSSRRRLSWEQMHTNVEDGDLAYLSLAQSVIRMSLDCSLKFAYLNTIVRVCTSSCLVVAYRKISVIIAILVHDWHQEHGLTYLEQLWNYMDSNKNESVSYDSRVRRRIR